MTQLIKLQDYISRYEADIFRYSSQFIRLKKQRWDAIKSAYNYNHSEVSQTMQTIDEYGEDDWFKEDDKSILGKLKEWVTKKLDKDEDLFSEQNETFLYDSKFIKKANSLEEVKRNFLNELFQFQIRWASTTLRGQSHVDHSLITEKSLRFFLQKFPDNFLLMYRPIFMIQNAPVETEIVLISPTTIYCITMLEGEESQVFRTDKGRYWYETMENKEIKHINPMISLTRMGKIIEGILSKHEIVLPVQKVVLCKNGYIENGYIPSGTEYIDVRTYKQWLIKKQRHPSPIKLNQLKGAQALLQHCQSLYVPRMEWESEEENF